MDRVPAKKILSFSEQGAGIWIHTYREEMLLARDEATIEAYTRVLEKFADPGIARWTLGGHLSCDACVVLT